MQAVTMPALSDTMDVGRLMRWLKKPGDAVKKGEAIAEVETDKAVMEVEAFHDGYLAGPLAPVNTDLPLGATIAYIADNPAEAAGGALPTAPPGMAKAAAAAAPPPAAGSPPSVAQPPAASPRTVRASPYARALAGRLDIDLAKVAPHQAEPIDAAELLKAVARPPTPDLKEGPPHRLERPSSLREAAARSMIASAATPTFRLTALLTLANERSLSLSLLLARACALAIKEHPLLNAAYTPDGIAYREQVDIGIAVDLPEGLITPVLRDVAERPLAALAEDWGILRDKLKSRRLVPQDYRGATFYLSDLGIFPVVQCFDSIIPVGASAILSVAAARPEGTMVTLSCDHRVVFGADGARFLTTLNGWFADPGRLVD
jgi:pyruvate dehydrogenase E2 component (dihydrolipoamide acetyltransferase)